MPWWNLQLSLLGALALVWLVGAWFTDRTVKRESRAIRLGYGLVLALGVFLIFRAQPTDGWLATPLIPAGDPSGAVGLALTAIGVAFTVWARVHLGRLWSGTRLVVPFLL